MDQPAHAPLMDEAALLQRCEAAMATAGSDPAAQRRALVPLIREFASTSRREAEARLIADGQGTACARALSDAQDMLVRTLFAMGGRVYKAHNPSAAERIAVVAVGGYGRGTLAPGSDIDLLFLLPYKQTAWGESLVEFLLYLLWDSGFKVGHAVRSIDEALRLARSDSTIQTAVLEARYLCGDRALYEELEKRYRSEIKAATIKAFIATKLAEQDARHARTGQSRYLVEPDVKDGKGGLRDLHTLFWIGKFIYAVKDAQGLVEKGVFNRSELKRFEKCEDFLWAVRCHMHFLSSRASDKLTFDIQSEIAQRFGYTAHGGLRPVERFMKHYFLVAKDVGDLTRIFCSALEARQMKRAPGLSRFFRPFVASDIRAIGNDPDFRLDAGRLTVADNSVFARDPVNLIRLFHVADTNNLTIHPDAFTLARRSLRLVNEALRQDGRANRLFLALLTQSRDPEAVLRRMNEAGVLGRFIPPFGRIVAMMQFNMYHHYTVDEHLLRAVGNVAEIEAGALRDEHPLSSELFHTLSPAGRNALYVATFLHDIAKGRKEDHSTAGGDIAAALCPRLGLSPSETETAAWLVRHHLVMSETAQMRDLNDFKTILDFAAQVRSPERLKLLLILTVADIRAVGPGVWNGWKGQLLRTLYFATAPVLDGGHVAMSRRDLVASAQSEFARSSRSEDDEQLRTYMSRHYDNYWVAVANERQLEHARLIEDTEAKGDKIGTTIRTDDFTAITEITVFAPDHPRLLAMLTGACAAAGANIASAEIYTTVDGMALDTLLINREFPEDADERRRAERVCDLIRKALKGELYLKTLVAQRRTKPRLSAFRVEPRVSVDNQSSNRFTVIEVNGLDRIGLLYDVTEALFRLNLNIASAQITTFGEKAVDVFYVTDLTGTKIDNQARQAQIETELLKVLGA